MRIRNRFGISDAPVAVGGSYRVTELLYLSLFVSAIAKFLLMTGVGIGGAVALIAECCGWKIVALGIEQVPGPLEPHQAERKLCSLIRKE